MYFKYGNSSGWWTRLSTSSRIPWNVVEDLSKLSQTKAFHIWYCAHIFMSSLRILLLRVNMPSSHPRLTTLILHARNLGMTRFDSTYLRMLYVEIESCSCWYFLNRDFANSKKSSNQFGFFYYCYSRCTWCLFVPWACSFLLSWLNGLFWLMKFRAF